VSAGADDVAGALLEALRPGSGIGVAVHDEQLRTLFISPSLAELSGTAPEAQLGRRLTEALPGEVGEVAEASLRAVAASRQPLLRLEPAVEAGRERGWLIHVYPLEHRGRELVAVVALDVTESRRAHERLQATRERLATAQRMARIGSWSWDVAGDRWHWSEELYRIAGLDPAGPPPDFATLLRAISAEDREAIRDVTTSALRDGLPYEIRFSVRGPGGRRRILRGRGVPERGPSGDVERIHGFAQDVTELARAESRQRAAADLGRRALSGIGFDALTREAAAAVAEELELDAAGAAELLARASPAGDPAAGAVGGDDEAFVAAVANVLASASARLRSEQEVAAQSEARGRLVALALDAEDRARRGISEALHDGPLQDLLALGHDVERLRPAADGDEAHLERVRTGLARAVGQIRDVMLDLHPVQLQVGGLESALAAICHQHAQAAGYSCHVEIEPAAAGRRDELVLSLGRELLRNAAKHARASEVRVRVSTDGAAIRLEVLDDGRGFPAERLADALGRGHIGVASSRERAEAIGGSFRVGPRDDGRPGTQAVALLPV